MELKIAPKIQFSKIHGPPLVQLLQKSRRVFLDLLQIRSLILLVQRVDNLSKSMIPVAASQNLQPRPFQLQRALRHHQGRFLIRHLAQPASWGEMRLRIRVRSRHWSPQFEKHPAAATPVLHKQSTAHQAAPTKYRTSLAMPRRPAPALSPSARFPAPNSTRTPHPPAPAKAAPQNNRDPAPATDNAFLAHPYAARSAIRQTFPSATMRSPAASSGSTPTAHTHPPQTVSPAARLRRSKPLRVSSPSPLPTSATSQSRRA